MRGKYDIFKFSHEIIMKIQYKKRFAKSFEKLDRTIQEKTILKINIFEKSPLLKEFNNHALT